MNAHLPNRRDRVGTTVLVLVVVLGAAAAYAAYRAAALSAGPPDVVLHAKATAQVDGGSPDLQEIWLQPSTGNVRYIAGAVGHEVTSVRNGRQAQRLLYGNRAVINVAETDNAPMLDVAARMLRYRSLVQNGSVTPSKDNGALIVRGEMPGSRSYVARIDGDTLLPLEETFYAAQGVVAEHVTWTYSVMESLPSASVPPELFDVSPGNGLTVERRTYLSLDEAAKFRAFPVYTLGPSYRDMKVVVVIDVRGSGPGYAQSSPTGVIERVEVVYQGNGKTLHVLSQPVETYLPTERAPNQLASGRSIVLSSGPGIVYGAGGGTTVVTAMKGSIVTVVGEGAEEAANHLSAAR